MDFYIGIIRYILPVLALFVFIRCVVSLLRNRARVHKMAQLINQTDNSVIEIDHWETSVGRSKSCDIALQYPTVSRFHGVISKRKNGWIVTDTFSKTGIKVNGKRVKGSAEIFDGDNILFGEIPLVFNCDEAINAENKKRLREAAGGTNKAVFIDVNSKKPYYLSKKNNIIGREESADIMFTDESVSKHHARVYMTSKGWAISDLDSSNGTMLNGRIIDQPQLIFDEDRLTFGNVTVIFYSK